MRMSFSPSGAIVSGLTPHRERRANIERTGEGIPALAIVGLHRGGRPPVSEPRPSQSVSGLRGPANPYPSLPFKPLAEDPGRRKVPLERTGGDLLVVKLGACKGSKGRHRNMRVPAVKISVVWTVRFIFPSNRYTALNVPVNDLRLSWALVSAPQVVSASLAHLTVRQARISHKLKISLPLSARPTTHPPPRETFISRLEMMVTIAIAATLAHLMALASTQALIPYLYKIKTTEKGLHR